MHRRLRLSLALGSTLVLSGLGCDSAGASETAAPTAEPAPAPAPPAPQADPQSSPREVCSHLVSVTQPEGTKDAEALAKLETECVTKLERIANRYDRLSSCLLNADTPDAVQACEQPLLSYEPLVAVAAATPGPSPEDICAHVTAVAQASAPEGATPPPAEEMAKHQDTCVRRLAERRTELGDEGYREVMDCVMKATSMAEVIGCEPDE